MLCTYQTPYQKNSFNTESYNVLWLNDSILVLKRNIEIIYKDSLPHTLPAAQLTIMLAASDNNGIYESMTDVIVFRPDVVDEMTVHIPGEIYP